MSHRQSRQQRSNFRTRQQAPLMKQLQGGAQILCPFCTPTHPLSPGEPSPCGTNLELNAVQIIIPGRVARMNHVTCIKCRQAGHGDMVKYMNSYVHLQDCAPGVQLLKAPPRFNILAGLVMKLPEGFRRGIETRTGRAQEVHELDTEGNETGRVLGHFFLPRRSRQTPAPPTVTPEAVNG